MLDLQKLNKSFGFAFSGLSYSFRHNQNIKIHTILGIVAIVVGMFLNLSEFEFLTITIMIVLVISAEMINTAIEEVINLLINEHRVEAKIAKDVSAGMVLLISSLAFFVGIVVFVPHLISLFNTSL